MADGFPTSRADALVLAPPSAGKTLLAELAILWAWHRGRRSCYLVPTRALADELTDGLKRRWGAMGLRVAAASRDHPETDRAWLEGRLDVTIAVYEKARAWLSGRRDMFHNVGCIVADELGSLAESGRAEWLDATLTALAGPRRPAGARLIGLATPAEPADALSAWLGAAPIVESERPAALVEAVLDIGDGRVAWRDRRTESPGSARWLTPESVALSVDEMAAVHSAHRRYSWPDDDDPNLAASTLALALTLARDRAQRVIVFVAARALAEEWAQLLAEKLSGESRDPSLDLLSWCRSRGVAFHHGELLNAARCDVENDARAGRLRILVSTATLAQGVNPQADVVLHSPWRLSQERWDEPPSVLPLDARRFSQQGGRAGRTLERKLSWSIVLTRGADAAERLATTLLDPLAARPDPWLLRHDPEMIVLQAIALSGATTHGELLAFLRATWAGRHPEGATALEHPIAIDDALDRLRAQWIIEIEPTGLRLTPWGEALAESGLMPGTARALRQAMESLADVAPNDALLISLLARWPDAMLLPIRLTARDRRGGGSRAALMESWSEFIRDDAARAWIEERWTPRGGLGQRDAVAAKKALTLIQFLAGHDDSANFEATGLMPGAIVAQAENAAWQADGATRLAAVLPAPMPWQQAWRDLSIRLPCGLPPGAEGLAGIARAGVPRDALLAAWRDGIDQPDALLAASSDARARWGLTDSLWNLAARSAAAAAAAAIGTRDTKLPRVDAHHPRESPTDFQPIAPSSVIIREIYPTELSPPTTGAEPITPDVLWLEGSREDIGRISFLGISIALSPLEYRLIGALAERVGQAVSYVELRKRLWPGAKVGDRQLNQHKRSLLRKLEAAAPIPDGFLQTRPGLGLALAPGAPHLIQWRR